MFVLKLNFWYTMNIMNKIRNVFNMQNFPIKYYAYNVSKKNRILFCMAKKDKNLSYFILIFACSIHFKMLKVNKSLYKVMIKNLIAQTFQ